MVGKKMFDINGLGWFSRGMALLFAFVLPLFTGPSKRPETVVAVAPAPALVARVCRRCGAEFMAPAITRGRPVVFCSEACRRATAADQRRAWEAANPPGARGDRREVVCLSCGKSFVPPRRQAGRHSGFCSAECRHARKLEHQHRWRAKKAARRLSEASVGPLFDPRHSHAEG